MFNGKIITKADFLVMIILIFLSVFSFLFAFSSKTEGNKVLNIYSDGRLYATYELEKTDKPFEVNVDNKFGSLTICVSKEKCYVKNSDCKDKLCVRQKEIVEANQILTCIPNKVIVEIASQKEKDVDMVAY